MVAVTVNEFDSGVIILRGQPNELQAVLSTETVLQGVPANSRMGSIKNFDLSSDGELAVLMTLNDNFADEALAVSQGSDIKVIMRLGNIAPGFQSGSTVTEISQFQRTAAGALVIGRVNNSTHALWFWDNDTVELIASVNPLKHSAPSAQYNDCLITLHGNVGIPLNALLNDSGDIAFNSRLVDPVTESLYTAACKETTITHYKDGVYTNIVSSESLFDGTEIAFIIRSELRSITADSTILSRHWINPTDASLAPGVYAITTNNPSDGTTNLIAVTGETLPPEFSIALDQSVANNAEAIQINAENTVLLDAKTSRGTSLLLGKGYGNQPYTDLTNVGQSTLQLVAGDESPAPDGYPATAYLTDIRPPILTDSGSVIFYATLKDASNASTSLTALWNATADGSNTKLVSTGDAIQVGGLPATVKALGREEFSFVQTQSTSNAGSLIRITADLPPETPNSVNWKESLLFVPLNGVAITQ